MGGDVEAGLAIAEMIEMCIRDRYMMLLIIISDMYLCPQPDIPGILFHKPVDDF